MIPTVVLLTFPIVLYYYWFSMLAYIITNAEIVFSLGHSALTTFHCPNMSIPVATAITPSKKFTLHCRLHKILNFVPSLLH